MAFLQLNKALKQCEGKDHSVQALMELPQISDADIRMGMSWHNKANTALIQAKRMFGQVNHPRSSS